MKKLLSLFLFFSFFSFSQVEIPIIDFASGDYPIGEKVKILYDKDWRPVTEIDSVEFYRTVNFKEKNIPKGRITDYYKNGNKQNSFFASYIGLNSKKLDSVVINGLNIRFDANGNKSIYSVYMDNILQGEYFIYYKTGGVNFKYNYEDGVLQGEGIQYYETGEVSQRFNYVDGLIQGEGIYYYTTGEVSSRFNYIDGLAQGESIGYYETGEVKQRFSYVNSLIHGEVINYYDTGEVFSIFNYRDGLVQGEGIRYYKSTEVKERFNYIDGLKQGESIGYYETGEVKEKSNFKDNIQQGLKTYYFKNGDVDYDELYSDDKRVDRKIALVIGNAAYLKGPLKNPVNDANLIAESLDKLDFEVFLHTDLATEDEMLDAIKNFGRKRKNYEVAFVYYAGHGIQLDNENYLLPVNEEFEFEDDVEDNGVSMQRVLRYLESTRENQLNFIVLDACRDNPFESNWNKTRSLKGAGLAKTPPPTGSLIAFSTDHGQTAADGDGGNSLYSQALAEKLLEENVSIEQVFKNVRTEVLRLSGDTQSPVEESKLTGDAFYLNKTNK